MPRRPTAELALAAGVALAFWSAEARAPGGAQAADGPSAARPLAQLRPAEALALRTTDTVRAVRRVGPAVVAIVSVSEPKLNPYQDSPWGRWYQPHQRERSWSLGSGVIVDPRGYVVTNEHVVSQGTKITVLMANGDERRARLVGASPSLDLAVLQIDRGAGLPVAVLGDSEALLHGEPAIAIGTPFGLTQTVSRGVVSATRRSFARRQRSYVDYIQTDASIHPGNSGGPLVNIVGEVIGINTAGLNRGPGIGLAIPAHVVRQVLADILRHGRVRYPYIGASVTGRKGGGVQVTHVAPASPASAAGLRPGDVIRRVHGFEVESAHEFWRIVRALVPGTRVTLRLDRGSVSTVVGGAVTAPPALGNRAFEIRLGLSLGNASEHADRLRLTRRRGVVLLHVVQGGPAWRRNLRAGDVILAVATKEVRSVDELNRIARTLKPGRGVHLIVARGKRVYSFTMTY